MSGAFLKKAKALFGHEEPEPLPAARKVSNRFHAVTVVAGPRACAAAKALAGERFLSREAPSLPLRGCGSAQCECHYAHHDDRRKGGRRAHDLGVSIDGYEGVDKRKSSKRGRRQND